MDRAIAGHCRAGYVRAGITVPIFDNGTLPASRNVKAPTFTSVKKAFLNVKAPSFTDVKKQFLNAKAPSFTDVKRHYLKGKAISFTDIKEAIKKYG